MEGILRAVSWVLAEGRVCSESPEKRAAVRSGIREDFLERVTLTLNLREVVKISKAGDRKGKGGKHLPGRGDSTSNGSGLRDRNFCLEVTRGWCAWDRPACDTVAGDLSRSMTKLLSEVLGEIKPDQRFRAGRLRATGVFFV